MRARMNGLEIVFGSDTYSRLRENLGAGERFPDPFFDVPSRRPGRYRSRSREFEG
jgi:hypothetical protein